MELLFDLSAVTLTEFGVGRDGNAGQQHVMVPVDAGVQRVLIDMAVETWRAMQRNTGTPGRYEPSEKHGGTEHLYLPVDDALATAMQMLHAAVNLPVDARALADPSDLYCYFARMTDTQGRRLTALRRASQFKGVLKNHLVSIFNDSLRLVADPVFRLDNDFDLVIDAAHVHILRPSGFEFAGRLQDAVMATVPKNIQAIQRDLAFVELASIGTYAAKHPRAARYLASIQGSGEAANVDKASLKRLCKRVGVKITESNGKITVADGHEIDFLEVLDRRRYAVALVRDRPELYRAPSRLKIG